MIKAFQQIKSRLQALWHYKSDQKGIINRYLNEGDNWNNHLENTKNYILFALPFSLKNVAILGSGWLLDVPIKELINKKLNIDLIDIIHPKQIQNKFANNNNVNFVTADLTNGLVELVQKSISFNQFCLHLKTWEAYKGLSKYDFVVSLNLLNQLDILLCDLIKKKFNVTDSELLPIRKIIQEFHVKSLPKGKSCLITDYEEINYIKNKLDNKAMELVYMGLDFLSEKKVWQWKFDTNKTYRLKYNTTFNVIAGKL